MKLISNYAIAGPVQDEVSYKTVKFDEYCTNRSPYTQTPSKELDEMWEKLYNCKIITLSRQFGSY
jgi:hypothetical protein